MRVDRRWGVEFGRGVGEGVISPALRGAALGHELHRAGQYTFCDRCGVFSSERGRKLLAACVGAPANPTAEYRLSLLRRGKNPHAVKVSLDAEPRSLVQVECAAFWERLMD
eukprot:5090647-Pyramimonas_sp.AAC.1